MISNIYSNTWSSLVVWTKEIIAEFPGHNLEFIDWEAHANIQELPNVDLMGPLSLSITEYDGELFQCNFAVGASTYAQDGSLFRQRAYISRVFDRMQAEQKITFYDASSAAKRSVIQMVPGSTIAPMNDITVRSFQYVQGTGLIVPAHWQE